MYNRSMTPISFKAFSTEVQKLAAPVARSTVDRLTDLAAKKGITPSMLPALKQVKNVATKDLRRAAEIAMSVRKHLKSVA